MLQVRDLDAFALAVDARVRLLPLGCDPARLFGVRVRDERIILVPFWSGVAREIPPWLTPPDGCVALALDTSGWAAPMDGDGIEETGRASRHPERKRIHHTALVYGDHPDDEIGVLTYEDEPPQIMRGALGAVPELMTACWARRPD
ncbi:MAG: hypothetical protein ACT4OX_06515 [Actinomycetota bacterium]